MKTTQRVGFIGVVVASLVMLGVLAQAQVPQLINYQGVLKDGGGTPITGTVSIVFSIYDVASGPNVALWSETQSSVTVTGGLFNVLLGSSTAFPAYFFQGTTPNRYLGVKVGSDAEMTPRQRLVSVGYTLKAEDADSLGDRIAITDKAQGFIGIGLNTPLVKVHQYGTPRTHYMLQAAAQNSNDRGIILGRHSRGSLAAPTASVNGDTLFDFSAQAYDGTAYGDAAVMRYELDGDVTTGNRPARIRFLTQEVGQACCNEVMRVTSNGRVGIGGVVAPTDRLHVLGNVRADAFNTPSSRELKRNIEPLGQDDYQKILGQIDDLQMVRFLYKHEGERPAHLGVIAEESPRQILDPTGKAVSLSDYASFLLAGLKAQSQEIQALKAHIQTLESRLPAPENHATALVE